MKNRDENAWNFMVVHGRAFAVGSISYFPVIFMRSAAVE
jgi:hypothetical protein